jgi:type I restriction enzyme, S subunit
MNPLLQTHFETALDHPNGIKKLRELILSLAMQGKLVIQDKNDQPARELLKEIQAEKERLVKEGIKKTDALPPIKEEEKPFVLPGGWEWVRLGDVCELITKGSSPTWQGVSYVDKNSGILFITSENVGKYKLLLEKRKYVEKKFNQIEPRSILKKYDILMNLVGASIGRVAFFNLDETANINQAVCLIRLIDINNYFNFDFLLHFLNSTICIDYMYDKQVDNARANLSMGNVNKFVIPLPPLAEQKRIVEKVDELLVLCDRLEEEIEKAEAKRGEILEGMVRV